MYGRRRARGGRRNGAMPGILAGSVFARADPEGGARLAEALMDHVLPKTRSSYETATRSYVAFCEVRSIPPWPVEIDTFCGWLMELVDPDTPASGNVKVTSLGMYLAGVKYTHGLRSRAPWPGEGSEQVRRVMRFLKRKYPTKGTPSKVPVTVEIVRVMLRQLPGWPDLAEMSAADRLFAVASVLGVKGFLRGGEFLTSSGSDRAILRRRDVDVRRVGNVLAVVVRVGQPKARWWLESAAVPCFAGPGMDDEFCPVRLWHGYTARVGGALAGDGPALRMGTGRALTREVMVRRTSELMADAGVAFVDELGRRMDVKASSWRAGAVLSAVRAKVSEPYIRAFGRWATSSWTNYMLRCPLDMQGAAQSIWASQAPPGSDGGLRVGAFDAQAFFAAGDELALRPAMARWGRT